MALATATRAGDWPQILGPQRNGRASGEHLLEAWPASGPEVVWEMPVGQGFAGPAVAGERAIVFHRQGNQEIAEARDAATGRALWKTTFDAYYVDTIAGDSGPRCVPVIHEGFVYLHGAGGDVYCLALESGKVRWSHDTHQEFGAPDGYFGAGSSPLVEGDMLLVNVGGGERGGIVAFRLADGALAWQVPDELASYSSPVAATIDGVRHAIFVTRYNALSVDPETGKVRFRTPYGLRGPTVNGATPLVLGDHLFLSSSYGLGALFGKIGRDRLEKVWANDETMSSQYPTCVLYEGHLYGIDGRQDVGVARLRCIEPATGKVLWTEEGFGMATLIASEDKLLCVKSAGDLVLVRANASRYEPLAEAKVFSTTVRALPALADGLLYARDMRTLKCLRVGTAQ